MQSPDFWPSVTQGGTEMWSMNPLLAPVGLAMGAGNYLRDTFLKNSQDANINAAIANINDSTYIGDQPYDVGQNLTNAFDTPAFSPLAAVRDWVQGGAATTINAAASSTVAAVRATGDAVAGSFSALGASMLPGWVKGGFTGGGDSTANQTGVPLWIKTAIVLSLIVGTAVLVKKEL